MTDVHSTLVAIDAATGCQQCEGPLGDSPSDSFCSSECQTAWFAGRTDPLIGYREPTDIGAHAINQVELSSPETTPVGSSEGPCGCYFCRRLAVTVPITFDIEVDTRQITATLEGLRDAIARVAEAYASPWSPVMAWPLLDEWQSVGVISALSQTAEVCEEPAEIDYDFELPTTALLVADEPPAPVMPAVTLDVESIQLIIDGYNGGFTTPRNFQHSINPRRTR